MNSNISRYPNDREVRVEWTWLHVLFIAMAALALALSISVLMRRGLAEWRTALELSGIAMNIAGAACSALKTPIYGLYHDGGALQLLKQRREQPWFQAGMLLFALGFVAQFVGLSSKI